MALRKTVISGSGSENRRAKDGGLPRGTGGPDTIRIAYNPAAKLTAPQIALIETLLGRVYGGLILSQTYALLDPNAELPEVK